ncbi:SAM-dependent methyltransferase [Methylobacterium indicum]|uniref:DUF938 domain-containing protein n=1 Tax=Methylobacterium indicum TaxID=1775910 RepID=UPI000734857D|nr:DUF938 domain-containing protein [Methylobacterium indicum]KTS25443.1 SAM-dependent methyltransferase [Methylobacterium indicum]KTS34159.1 SAM-dependent methyltransferase [Methylobacterium indicum]KTS53189.1 SAM-dependent methyltransferase [Methylobacterium indicum]
MLEWDAVLIQPLSTGDALFAPAVARNREPILDVLHRLLPVSGLVLEVASGSGEHIIHFASALPRLRWQPTDADPRALRSIAAHAHDTGLDNVLAPQFLDARAQPWPVACADAVLAINMTHIAPWSATVGLMAGAGGILPEGGLLYLYGPFRVAGAHTAPSNATFDADLRARDPAWGVRDVEAISEAGLAQGLSLVERIPMPANNFSLVYRRGRYRNP